MKPEAELLADISNGVDGVESSVDRGTGRAVDEEGREAFLSVLQYQFLQVTGTHPAMGVNIHLSAVINSQAQGGCCSLQTVVTLTISDKVLTKLRLQLKVTICPGCCQYTTTTTTTRFIIYRPASCEDSLLGIQD